MVLMIFALNLNNNNKKLIMKWLSFKFICYKLKKA